MSDEKTRKGSGVLALMAAMLIASGAGLFWVAWRGIQMMKSEPAAPQGVVENPAVLVGKTDFVGTWEGGRVTMDIGAGGHVDYEKKRGSGSEAIHGALSFDPSGDIVIDVHVTTKHLHVNKPPHLDGTRWTMTLDGVEMQRR